MSKGLDEVPQDGGGNHKDKVSALSVSYEWMQTAGKKNTAAHCTSHHSH